MAIGHETTVGGLVAQYPGLARVFERFGIDYCCGGKRTLEDAAARAGADSGLGSGQVEEAEQAGQRQQAQRRVPKSEQTSRPRMPQ